MAPDDDAALSAVEGWLRRPGELFEEEWTGYQPRHDGPAVSPIWWMEPRDDAPNEAFELDDEMAKAWDLLCENPAFRVWFEENWAALSGGARATSSPCETAAVRPCASWSQTPSK